MAAYEDLDLHGTRPDPGRVGFLLQEALLRARRGHRGLRVIHGRGEFVLARLAQAWLQTQQLEFEQGVFNPGETRIAAPTVQRWKKAAG